MKLTLHVNLSNFLKCIFSHLVVGASVVLESQDPLID